MSNLRGANFSNHTQVFAKLAAEIALRYHHKVLDREHILLAIVWSPDQELTELYKRLGLDISQLEKLLISDLRQRPPSLKIPQTIKDLHRSPEIRSIIDQAIANSKRLWAEQTSSTHFFLSVIESYFTKETHSKSNLVKFLEGENISPARIQKLLLKIQSGL